VESREFIDDPRADVLCDGVAVPVAACKRVVEHDALRGLVHHNEYEVVSTEDRHEQDVQLCDSDADLCQVSLDRAVHVARLRLVERTIEVRRYHVHFLLLVEASAIEQSCKRGDDLVRDPFAR